MIKIVDGVEVQMTQTEIDQRAADEAAWAADAARRYALRQEQSCGMARWEREMVIAVLPAEHPQRQKAEQVEATMTALRG